ncbi:OsmC family protein [Caulobacter sp. RHG1]|uniref:OsmC family protein n=1 Tax=Caulobacter sp. (strain RHG1) TaxID=2545762 RepID=UPI0015546EC9|nr:OsmC family protein [Caulobacter sp. RHG1]NQE63965.1 Hydrolase, alpha/beta fold family [Caulobacter sp. RHG1]
MTETPATRPSATADDSGHGGLQTFVTAGPATIVADIAAAKGGLDLGPDPHELVCAGLAACTSMTLRLYANQKNWDIAAMHVEVFHHFDADQTPHDRFERTITLEGNLNDEQRERLFQIADKCPIHKLLTAGARVVTTVGGE